MPLLEPYPLTAVPTQRCVCLERECNGRGERSGFRERDKISSSKGQRHRLIQLNGHLEREGGRERKNQVRRGLAACGWWGCGLAAGYGGVATYLLVLLVHRRILSEADLSTANVT